MNSSFERAVTRFRNLSYRYDFPRRIRYAVAAGAAAVAVFLTRGHATASLARAAPSILFLVVVLSSWYGGQGPGVTAALIVVAGNEVLAKDSTIAAQSRTDDIILLVGLTAVAFALSSIRAQRRGCGYSVGKFPTQVRTPHANGTPSPILKNSQVTTIREVVCATCGGGGPFEDPTNGANLRESLICPVCGSNSRDRMLMYGLAVSLGKRLPIREWPANPDLRIFETAGYRGHPRYLGEKYDYYNTRYDPEKIAAGGDIRCYADVQNLPYPSEFFDCALSSDVFEHVRLDDRGFCEIFRVLKPGGIFVLQAPYGHVPNTHVLVRPEGDKDIFLEPPQYHAERTLVYRVYGVDLLDRLRNLGFSVTRLQMAMPEYGIVAQDTFLARKGGYNEFIST